MWSMLLFIFWFIRTLLPQAILCKRGLLELTFVYLNFGQMGDALLERAERRGQTDEPPLYRFRANKTHPVQASVAMMSALGHSFLRKSPTSAAGVCYARFSSTFTSLCDIMLWPKLRSSQQQMRRREEIIDVQLAFSPQKGGARAA